MKTRGEALTEGKATGGVEPLHWEADGLRILDQRRLPAEESWLVARDVETVAQAIRDMAVRGAPAIGIAAAYGVVLAARQRWRENPAAWRPAVAADCARLAATRPTAINLAWALTRMERLLARLPDDAAPEAALLAEARAIHEEDRSQNLRMAEWGAAMIEGPAAVLTHCNTGALATGGHGTALGVIRTGWLTGRIRHVFATETRPWLQGARLTAWELAREGIPVTLITDAAAASIMRRHGIAWLIVGADRIAANGDVANKIGTYALALAARAHGARVMVVAPSSSVDMAIATGDDIPLEERSAAEIWRATGAAEPPAGLRIANPAFDVTPAGLVDVLVTERGVIERPDAGRMRAVFASS